MEIPISIHLLNIVSITHVQMTRHLLLVLISVISAVNITTNAQSIEKYSELTDKSVLKAGYFDFYWNAEDGKIYLQIDKWKHEFLYVSFLSAGVGSNDIGLDRGQLGSTRVVRFERFGPKVLLIQSNYDYRASSDNPEERQAVEEAFAQSVIGGFEIIAEKDNSALVDLTDFIVRDAHGVVRTLKNTDQGAYALDKEKSVVDHEYCKNFKLNTEFQAILTFSGEPAGSYVREVVPDPNLITVRQRHSFVALPDEDYEMRTFDPRSGYGNIAYKDYAQPIEQDITKRYIVRHRLQKKNPAKDVSEPVEPIIYYVDRGAPEPIRSALIEGASWWNEAFEAAGFRNAFQVKILPEGADPLDIRYNVIQWVHRSTRGWSYGASIVDPRTGEIIKGHVSLGSLRVRQDYLIAQGLLAPFKEDQSATNAMTGMALARLRQLSAHEVGHTLGLAHNYVASTYDRGSVMDYPHPLIELDEQGNIDLSNAYDTGIGEWDKIAIQYGYSQFKEKKDEQMELSKILKKGIDQGIFFLSDQDARPPGSAHPQAHLWDNGTDAADELNRIMNIRQKALTGFSENNIPDGVPMSELEDVLVPIYFLHRYQTEAAIKMIGGLAYNYAIRGDGTFTTRMIDPEIQEKALNAVLNTISPANLTLDESIIRLIPPKAKGYYRDRENVEGYTGLTFDPLSFAETSAEMTLKLLLHPERCSRLAELHARDESQLSLDHVYEKVYNFLFDVDSPDDFEDAILFLTRNSFIDELIHLASNPETSSLVRAKTRDFLMKILKQKLENADPYLIGKLGKFFEQPVEIKPSRPLKAPAGSPIGAGIPTIGCSFDQ